MTRSDRRLAVLAMASALALAGKSICFEAATANAAEKNPSAADIQVKVVRAAKAWFAAELHITGYLVAKDEAVVYLDRGYRVSEVLANDGDRVNSGQILARLSREGPAQAEGPTGGPPAGPPPGAAGRPPPSAAGAATAAAPAPPATKDLKAPASGVIIRSTAVVGAGAAPPGMPAEPLFRIAIDNEIELDAEVGGVHTPQLAVGQTARVDIENYSLNGKVRLIPATIDPKYQVSYARISLEHDPRLRIGMFARATIEANRSRGISVPRSAVFYRTEGPSVQLVRDDIVETRLVRVGLQSDTDTEIIEGLHEGDLVVANAGSSLRDGVKVKPIDSDATRTELR